MAHAQRLSDEGVVFGRDAARAADAAAAGRDRMREEKHDGDRRGEDSDTVVATPSPPVGATVTPFSETKPLSEFEKGLSRTPYR